MCLLLTNSYNLNHISYLWSTTWWYLSSAWQAHLASLCILTTRSTLLCYTVPSAVSDYMSPANRTQVFWQQAPLVTEPSHWPCTVISHEVEFTSIKCIRICSFVVANLGFRLNCIWNQLKCKVPGAPVQGFLDQIILSGMMDLKCGQHLLVAAQINKHGRRMLCFIYLLLFHHPFTPSY